MKNGKSKDVPELLLYTNHSISCKWYQCCGKSRSGWEKCVWNMMLSDSPADCLDNAMGTVICSVDKCVTRRMEFLLWLITSHFLKFVIVVVDSTDRERISVTKEELYKMLAHEVSRPYVFFVWVFIVGKIWMIRVQGSRFARYLWKLWLTPAGWRQTRMERSLSSEAQSKHHQSRSPSCRLCCSRAVVFLLEALSVVKLLVKL